MTQAQLGSLPALGRTAPLLPSGDGLTYGDAYSLDVINLPYVGASAEVVIPLSQAVPAQGQVKVFNHQTGWQALDLAAGDELATAPFVAGEPGRCPAPGDVQYQSGLTPGHQCLLLRISDGGTNDADNNDGVKEDGQGDVNGRVELLVALAAPQSTPVKPGDPVTGSIQTGLKGGGSLDILLTLLLAPLALILRRRKNHAK